MMKNARRYARVVTVGISALLLLSGVLVGCSSNDQSAATSGQSAAKPNPNRRPQMKAPVRGTGPMKPVEP